jgi:hypothetical protein
MLRSSEGTFRSTHQFGAAAASIPDQDVPELPGIALVDILGEKAGAILQRVPVGIVASDRAKIGQLDFKRSKAEADQFELIPFHFR